MVRLGIATGSRGPSGESSGHRSVVSTDQHLYPYPVIRNEGEPHHSQQVILGPSTSSQLQHRLDSQYENILPPDTRISPLRLRNEGSLTSTSISPIASGSSSNVVAMASKSQISGWPRVARDSGDSVIRSQKRTYRETEDTPDSHENYPKDVKRCPMCRSPYPSGVVHQCPATVQHGNNFYGWSGAKEKGYDKYSVPDQHGNSYSSSYSDNIPQHMTATEGGLNFSNRVPGLRVPMVSVSPHSLSPSTSNLHTIHHEDQFPSMSNPSVSKSCAPPPLERIDPPRSPRCLSPTRPSTSHEGSSMERQGQSSPVWAEGNYVPSSSVSSDNWETPTSLISRLSARLTAGTNQEDKNYRNCPSPSMSETSSVSMSSSYFSHQESSQPCDPFNMAHQELVEEFSKTHAPPPETSRPSMKSHTTEKPKERQSHKRGRRYTSSESTSSDINVGDLSLQGSQDSDSDDNYSVGYLDENGKLPDLDTLLKYIREPDLTPYSLDKSSIENFLEPHEIGHINHLIKSVSDAMLTISLPETLYKSKGFTPLDYMDIHLNCVLRHFFFVFKNEDFLNLVMHDQIALLDGCTLRAIQCTSLYLFNKDAGCWHIPGGTNKANHPVIHVSDLMKVFPQGFVTRTHELHCIAAKLGFDWPMGVIASCILMYTPLKRVIQEIEKIDVLRNKYVNLLLKYVTWKNGTYNASLLFPEILKLLDALLLHVEDFASITLKLNEEEVIAVEERLATLTLSQMAPYGCQSNKFKEKVASWSTLDCVKLGDIQKRLCMAMHMSMMESATTHYSTSSGLSKDDQIITTQCRTLPQLMLPSSVECSDDKLLEHSGYLSSKMVQQNKEMRNISALAHKDLMMLRKFLEEVTNREGTLVVQNIKEKMDSNQIKKIINKLCS
ncbi:uncharacterized protein [Palaemon carinicauda]|uniref:uncharacterized protein n=1 Tax=Palaemon carinicauda TaxID=392227 RepID=UPI0035B5EB79